MRFSNEFGFCDLNPFPGCNQLTVSNHAFVYKEHRGKGYGSYNHRARLKRAKEMGYDAMICTVKEDNTPQISIMLKNKWTKVFEFFSKEAGMLIHVYMRHL